MFADRLPPRGRRAARRARVRPLALTAAVAGCASLLAACGGGGGGQASSNAKSASPPTAASNASGGGAKLALKADATGQLRFDKSSLNAKAGNITIVMKNPSQLSHSVAIEGNGVDKDGQVVTHGGTSTVSADLKPGSYTFYCTVPGHRQAGMEGTLTVR